MSNIIAKYSSFVKEQIDFNQRSAIKYRTREDFLRAEQHTYRAEKFSELLNDLSSLNGIVLQKTSNNPLTLTPADIQNLPEELLQELSVSDSDRRDFLVIDLINKNGGTSTIDKLLIGIYRETGEIEKRQKITARLYRMAKKELIYPHPEKKGVYSTSPLAPDENEPVEEDLKDEDMPIDE